MCTVSGVDGSFRFTRSNAFKSNAFKQVQAAGIRLTTTVQSMLSPSAPQASAPGSSPESASVGADPLVWKTSHFRNVAVKRISALVSGGGTANHLTGSPVTN